MSPLPPSTDFHFKPTADQELLLRASLLPTRDAVDAFTKWKSVVDIGEIDGGSRRLLPLLYRNLKSHGVTDPLMKTFKGMYRRTWYENLLLFHGASGLMRALYESGIETLLLKGAALIPLHYGDPGLRPMSDLDLLVPVDSASKAIRIIFAESYAAVVGRSVSIDRLTESEIYKASIHSEHFVDAQGRGIDLHWHTLYDSLHVDADKEFWDGSVPAVFQEIPTRAFNPADQLLHVCYHGVDWNPVSPIRWVADAMTILRSSPDLDWERLLKQTERHGLTIEMRESLDYLSQTLKAPVPDRVLDTLKQMPVSTANAVWYRIKTRRSPYGMFDRFLWLVRTYLRSGRRPDRGKKVGFARFLQHLWGVDHVWQVPVYATSAAFTRLRAWSHRSPITGTSE